MSRNFSDEIKKAAIADYVDGVSSVEVGRKYSASPSTVQRWVNADPITKRLAEEKKEQNTRDVLKYLDEKTEGYKRFVDYYLQRLDPDLNSDKLNELSEMQLTTIFGVLTDKFLKAKEIMQKQQSSDEQGETVVIRFDVPRD